MSDHLTGPAGEARRVPAERLDEVRTGNVAATLEYWWVRIPGQTMMVAHLAPGAGEEIADVAALEWVALPAGALDTFTIGLITLADLPGVKEAKKGFPWVTHELLVQTLDTSEAPVPFESPLASWRTMQPHNVGVQFEVADDGQARALVEEIARAMVEGILPAEVQAFVPERRKMMTVAPLHQLWRDTVSSTAEHQRTGGTHEEPRPAP